jgi:hypothetical protein
VDTDTVNTAEIPIVKTAEIPIVKTAEIPKVKTAEIPIVKTAEIPIVKEDTVKTADIPMSRRMAGFAEFVTCSDVRLRNLLDDDYILVDVLSWVD